MQEKSPNERKVCCPASVDMSTLPNSVKDRKEKGAGNKIYQFQRVAKASYSVYISGEGSDLIKSDKGQKQIGSSKYPCTTTNTFCREYLSLSLPNIGSISTEKARKLMLGFFLQRQEKQSLMKNIFCKRRWCSIWRKPSKGTSWWNWKEEKVTLDFCMAALSLSKARETSNNIQTWKSWWIPMWNFGKAKKPPISHMLNIMAVLDLNRRKELGYNLSTKMGQVGQGYKNGRGQGLLLNIISAINRYSDREGEKTC